jgi:hypothetical protein
MEEKIANSIALHQATINELKDIKKKVENNIDDKVRFRIETRQIFRMWEPYITKCKDKMDVSPHTMQVILDEAIKIERGRIDKLIDMEIENRLKKEKKKK